MYHSEDNLVILDGPIDLFLVSASALQLIQQSLLYVLSSMWDGAYKRYFAANQ